LVRGDGILCQYAHFFSHPRQQKQTELLCYGLTISHNEWWIEN